MIECFVIARLVAKPELRRDRDGREYAAFKAIAPTQSGRGIFLRGTTFQPDSCRVLASAQPGDQVALAGRLQPQGETNSARQPVCDLRASTVLDAGRAGALRTEVREG